MNKTAIKNFAIWARVTLLEAVKQRSYEYEITENGENDPNADVIAGRPLTAQEKQQRRHLIQEIQAKTFRQTMEEAAYTWFNRFIALRYMEVNGYLPSRVRVFTNEMGEFKPEILKEAMTLDLPGLDREAILSLLEKQDNESLYKMLLIAQCNALSESLPQMFQQIANWTELLFPANLLKPDSVLGRMVSDIPEEDWQDQVQIIGWLYQYYNTELKDETFAQLKKNVKISKERIPAATQLFTPDWIVRYMVENSLGRLWVEGHPNGELRQSWKYYLEEAEQEPQVQKQLEALRSEYAALRPEDIRLIDPCMGSGHILVYAFDVLMQIYEACGWNQRDAAQSILENNLYGLDIDDRAAQLAYFAVMMKARSYDRRLFSRGIQPKIYAIAESNGIPQQTVDYFCNGDDKLRINLAKVMTQMRDAKEYGSILNITGVDFAALNARFGEIREDIHLLRQPALEQLLPVVQSAQLLARSYHVVVTNPPYMGGSGMGNKLSEFVKKNYPDSKSDLFAVFIEHGFQMIVPTGFASMITMESWMFLSSFEKLRQMILNGHTIQNMVHMPYLGKGGTSLGINFGTAAVIFRKDYCENFNSQFDYICYYETDDEGVPFAFPTINERYKAAKAANFSKIPGSPVAYWVSENFIATFEKGISIDEISDFTGSQHKTADNEQFLRNIWEVDSASVERGNWIFYIKGGEYRKWYGNIDLFVNWTSEAKNFYTNNCTSNMIKERYWFQEGITYTSLSSFANGFRYLPPIGIFDIKGPSIISLKNMHYCLGFFNSIVAHQFFKLLNPTITLQVKDVKNTPLIIKEENSEEINILSKNNIAMSKSDWDSYETSWDFKRNPLV